MKSKHTIVLTMAILLIAAPSLAQLSLYTSCEGSQVDVMITHMNSYHENPEGVVIKVQAKILGTCEDPFWVDMEPIPMTPFMGYEEFSFSFASPDPDRYFMYTALGVNPDGSTFFLPPAGDTGPVDFCGVSDATIARGWLNTDAYGDVYLEPCPDSCWEATPFTCLVIFDPDYTEWVNYADTGEPVDLMGFSGIHGMPGAPCVWGSLVMPTPGNEGCGAVSNQSLTFDAIKARFR